MKNTRPINLDLTTIKFPLTAIASITHRISGVLVFLFIPVLLYALQQSLQSAESFESLQQCLHSLPMKITFWAFLTALLFHLLAGIRHVIMDCGFAESLKAAKSTSVLLFLITAVGSILLGVWLW